MEVRFAVINFLFYNLIDMKDFDAFIIIIFVSIIAFFLFSGIIVGIKKTFQLSPETNTVDTSRLMRQQSEKARQSTEQYEKFMDKSEQDLRDFERRNQMNDPAVLQREQKRRINEINEQQERFMQQQKRKLRDTHQ